MMCVICGKDNNILCILSTYIYTSSLCHRVSISMLRTPKKYLVLKATHKSSLFFFVCRTYFIHSGCRFQRDLYSCGIFPIASHLNQGLPFSSSLPTKTRREESGNRSTQQAIACTVLVFKLTPTPLVPTYLHYLVVGKQCLIPWLIPLIIHISHGGREVARNCVGVKKISVGIVSWLCWSKLQITITILTQFLLEKE